MIDHGTMIKVADIGGDGQDVPFEQAFSNLAHAYLRDKAPSLLDHELGFQLLDRNDENTKAVGVIAFKVGANHLFAPVFFLSGDLKGHELLYLKNQDMFVPMKENWLNYILNRKPNILGSGVSRQSSTLGVMQPDLNRLSQSPYKYAMHVIPAVREFMPKYAHLASSSFSDALNEYQTHCNERLDLGHFIKQASLPMLQSVVEMFRSRPKLAAAFEKWHGMEELSTAIKQAGVRLRHNSVLDNPFVMVPKYRQGQVTGSIIDVLEKQADEGKAEDAKQKIEIITHDSSHTEPPEDVTEEEAEKLLKDEVLIRDHRGGDEVSVAYNVQVEEKLTNPTDTGIYKVLVKAGDFKKCLVVVAPHGPDGRHTHVVIVDLEGDKNWCNCPRDDVWVTGEIDEGSLGGEESWREWFDKQPEGSLSTSELTRYIAIGPRRNGTCPFRVDKELGSSEGGQTSYEVDFADHANYGRGLSMGLHRFHNPSDYEWFDEYDKYRDGQRVHHDAKIGTDLRSNHGDVYLPKGYKIIKVKATAEDKWQKKQRDKDGMPGPGPPDNMGSEDSPIQPGNILDAQLRIMTKTAEMSIKNDGSQYFVNDSVGMRLNDALIHLVRDHGFREEMGRHLLKTAGVKPLRFRVKYAQDPFLTNQGPDAPAIQDPETGGYNPMGWPGPTQTTYEEEFVVPDLQASNTDPSIYNVNPANMPDPMDANTVQHAADTGQKEVFDTAMIGSMLKAVRDDTMIDRYLPDLVKGMDRMGRILFMFYWHQDQFAERYGKQDLPELEDSLRNAFEMNGDVILFLKQKTIEPYPEEDVRDLDLSAVADV